MGQRKIAAFIFLNFNLFVFLMHAIEGIKVETGEFGAHMMVELVNDGPVTMLIDSEKNF